MSTQRLKAAKKAKVELDYAQYQKRIFDKLAQEQAVREEDVEQWLTRVNAAEATNDAALAQLERAKLQYKSEIEGVNTTVANMEAQLRLARYYLDNTTLTAPEDGHMINLQVRAGMVAGTFRVGGIAAFIADADRYLLATYFQENLKYVKRWPAGRSFTRPLSWSDLCWRGGAGLARQWHRTVLAE